MTTTKLCLALALVGSVAAGGAGCDNPTKTGPANDVIFFGRLADTYELCFYVQEDFTALVPSTACDREGITAYSFNIEVEGGSDGDSEPCSFDIRIGEPIPIDEDGSFQFPEGESDFQVSGTIAFDSGFDSANGTAGVLLDGTVESLCEVTWSATSDPICREAEFARCQLLEDCCDSIYMVPPIRNECQEVVDACDPDACDALLAGFEECQQPPICPVLEDPGFVCTALDECCLSFAPLPTREDILECQAVALMCNPLVCLDELSQYEECAGLVPP